MGKNTNATEPTLIRHLSDMDHLFSHGASVLLEEDPLLYKFHTIEKAFGAEGELAFGVTTLYNGTIGGEFYMTHGHYHEGAGAEIYQCFSGEGRLLLQTREGQLEIHKFNKDSLVYIPGGWGHRTINVGKEPLIFGAIWPTGIGHDYDAMLTNDFKVRIFAGENGPKIISKTEKGEI